MTDTALAPTTAILEPQDDTDVIIDLSGLSFRESMDMSIMQSKLGRINVLNARLQAGDAPPSILDEILVLSDPSMLEAIFKESCKQFSRVVRAVPRDWFVRDAPEDLPLSVTETFEWLRADKAKQLRQMISTAQEKAKN